MDRIRKPWYMLLPQVPMGLLWKHPIAFVCGDSVLFWPTGNKWFESENALKSQESGYNPALGCSVLHKANLFQLTRFQIEHSRPEMSNACPLRTKTYQTMSLRFCRAICLAGPFTKPSQLMLACSSSTNLLACVIAQQLFLLAVVRHSIQSLGVPTGPLTTHCWSRYPQRQPTR